MFNTRQDRNLNLGPCSWKAKMVPLRQSRRHNFQVNFTALRSPNGHLAFFQISRKQKIFEQFNLDFHTQFTKGFLLAKYEEIGFFTSVVDFLIFAVMSSK